MPSIETHLRIVNNTASAMSNIAVSEIDNFDWDGDSRPDHNFQNVSIGVAGYREEREELNWWASSAWYRMTIDFANGEQITFRNDQYDARDTYQRDIGIEGRSAGLYQGTQVSGSDLNTITFTERVVAASWMSKLPGGRKLSELTIPGTHDTCALYGGPLVQTQTLSLREQLDAGIRFIDIRCRHIEDRFAIHHGMVYQNLMFGTGVRDVCVQFLADHPTETIVMCVKHEYDDESDTRTFEDTFDWYLAGFESSWYLGDQIPTLDTVRGKIVLVRRFDAVRTPKGIDATGWQDDTTFIVTHNSVTLNVQDQYTVPTIFNIADKWDRVRKQLEAAQIGAVSDLYLNFSSGTSAGAYPNAVAKGALGIDGVNTRMMGYLSAKTPARFGIVIMDFPEYPDSLLPHKLITLNSLS